MDLLIVGRDAPTQASDKNIEIWGDTIEVVQQFLGSMISADNTLDAEINHKVASAGFAWHQLNMSKLWCSKFLMLTSKVKIFRTIVLSILLYASETWPALQSYITRLNVFQVQCLRTRCGFSVPDRKTNDSILELCKLPTIADEVCFGWLRCLGHASRISDDRHPQKLLLGQMLGTGVRGRPTDSWNKMICSDLLKLGAAYSWYRTVFDRTAWRQLIAPVHTYLRPGLNQTRLMMMMMDLLPLLSTT